MDMKATADTGAQVDVIGTDHVERMGLQIAFLLRTKMSLNCANNSPAGNLGVFFARVKGKHYKTAGIEAVKSEPTPSLPDSDSGNDSELDENNQSVGQGGIFFLASCEPR